MRTKNQETLDRILKFVNKYYEEESIEEYVSLPVSMFGKGDFYILRAKGDSMVDAGIDEDDLLVIERNCPALEGDAMDRCWHSWKRANQTANSK